MEEKHISTYALIEKYGFYKATIQRLRRNQSVNLRTVDDLCQILDCTVEDIVEIILEPDVPLSRTIRKNP
jgi:DNA-binding Xre family transcriptional regulator